MLPTPINDIEGDPVDNSDTGRQPESWHSENAESCMTLLNSGKSGLQTTDAQARLAEHGPNRLEPPRRRGPLMRLLLQFNNVLVYVLMSDVVKGFVTPQLSRFFRLCQLLSMITSMEPFRDRFIGATLGSV
jgi:magnesium-transporting ATPase (P-type)